MYGPCPPGHWTGVAGRQAFKHLKPGGRYRVARPFTDYDGDTHEANETWTFLGSNFLPYDDGLSLFVSLDGEREWHIRMCWRPEDQGAVIDALKAYVERL